MSNALPMTTRRREALALVASDDVRYDALCAIYWVKGAPVGNWRRRTLAELRSAALIDLSSEKDADGFTKIVMTDSGWVALES